MSGAAPLAGAIAARLAIPASQRGIALGLVGLVLASLAVQLLGIFHRNINWDEFLFLSIIHAVANGEGVGLLQTAYAHLFGWLIRLGGDEIMQITVARGAYLALWMVSLALLYRLARRLLDPLGALAGVAFFALHSFSVTHAASFRIDGLLLPVLLAVALLLLKPTTLRVGAAGALSGLAAALTIKAALWAPAFAAVLAVGLWHERNRLRPVLAGTAAAIASFAAIMLAHSWWLTAGDAPAPGISAQGLSRIGVRMLLEDGLLPRAEVLRLAVMQNPATIILIITGLGLAITGLRQATDRRKALLLLLLALPVLSLAFYANAWPYAYIVLVPTTCLLAGLALSHLVRGSEPIRVLAAAICLALAALPMAVAAWSLRHDQQAQQKQIVAIVHELFDAPVAYIDKGGMIASFPRQPIFLSRWGMKNYREAKVPRFARYVREAQPPLLIVNTPILDVWDKEMIEQVDPRFRLLEEDEAALRAAFAPYWGAIHLAGRQWLDLDEGEAVSFDIVVAGDYTLLSQHPARVDGRTHAPGATLTLEAGPHRLEAGGFEPDLRLLWGRDLAIPAEAPSPMPIYSGL